MSKKNSFMSVYNMVAIWTLRRKNERNRNSARYNLLALINRGVSRHGASLRTPPFYKSIYRIASSIEVLYNMGRFFAMIYLSLLS